MVQRRVVTVTCDGCGRADSEAVTVKMHRVRVDSADEVAVDACDVCWASAVGPLAVLLSKGADSSSVSVVQDLVHDSAYALSVGVSTVSRVRNTPSEHAVMFRRPSHVDE